jgi:uncharacterized membrane protein YeiH
MEHWYQQVYQYLKVEMFADALEIDDGAKVNGVDVVYIVGIGDLATIGKSMLRNQELEPVPPLWILSQYTIVIMAFAHLIVHMRFRTRHALGG